MANRCSTLIIIRAMQIKTTMEYLTPVRMAFIKENTKKQMLVRMWEKAMAPTPVLLPGKSHGRRSLVGCSPWSCYWATSLSLFTSMHWRRKWQPTPVFLLENPRVGGVWWAAIYGIAQSRTWLKWLSSSSSSSEDVGKREPLCSVGGNVNWCSHCGKHMEVS